MRNLALLVVMAFSGIMMVYCGEDEMACRPGETGECSCDGNAMIGERTCTDEGKWGGCRGCSACVPGKVMDCPCIGGGKGVQECSESGDSWGECTGCGEAVGETDPTELGECDYTTCIGDICEEPSDCCDASACGSWLFLPEYGFSENYCYPMCDPEEAGSCKCDDVCVPIDDGLALCLPEGGFYIESLEIPVGGDMDSAVLIDAGETSYEAFIGADDIPASVIYAFWSEYEDENGEAQRELIIRSDGISLSNDIWISVVYIPEALFLKGEDRYPYINESDEYNFFFEFYSGNLDSSGSISELWLESIGEDAELEIGATCEPCTADDAECETCEFSIAATFFGIRTKVELPD